MNAKEKRRELYKGILRHLLAGILAAAMAAMTAMPAYGAVQDYTNQYGPPEWVGNVRDQEQKWNTHVNISLGAITEDAVTVNVSAPNHTNKNEGAVTRKYWSTAIQYSIDGGPWYSTDQYHRDGSLPWAGYDQAVSASVTVPRTNTARRITIRSVSLLFVYYDMSSSTRRVWNYYYNYPRTVLIPPKDHYEHFRTVTGSTVWTAPEDGNYQFHVIGPGGSGTSSSYYSGGSGGGGGGYAVHRVYLKKGETANISISAAQSTLAVKGTNVIAYAGTAGGAGGTARGGNISNTTGTAGGAGLRLKAGYDSDDDQIYLNMGGYGGAAQGLYGGAGGSFVWSNPGISGLCYGDGGGGAANGAGAAGSGGAVVIEIPADRIAPEILRVDTPPYWEPGAVAAIYAQDAKSGVAGYAVTKDSGVPSSWQPSNKCSISTGLQYAWAIDAVGNISEPFPFSPAVDSDAPVIQNVTVDTAFADGLIHSDVTIKAEDPIDTGDAASGVKWYAVTSSAEPPEESNWQTSDTVTTEGHGARYAWAIDAVGNVSKSYLFTIIAPPEYIIQDAAVVVTDPDGKPAEGCIVEIVNGSGTVIGTGETDINGYTKIPEVPVGEYELILRDPDGNVVGTGSTTVTPDGIAGGVTGGGHTASIFPAEEYITQIITGTVTDSEGTPVEGCTVEIVNSNDRVIGSDTTDGYGCFEISGIPPGEYSIVIRNPEGDIVGTGIITVTPDKVSGGSTGGDYNAAVPANRATQDVTGTITDYEGNPAADHLVKLVNRHDRVVGTDRTDKTGYFEFLGVPVGKYTILVQAPNGNIVGSGHISVTPEGVSGSLTKGRYSAALSHLVRKKEEERETDPGIYWELALKDVQKKALAGKKTIRLGYLPNYRLPVWWLEELQALNLDVELSFYTLNYGGSSAVLWSFHSGDIGSFPAGRISYDLETSDNKLPVTAPEGEMVLRQIQIKHPEELPFPFTLEVTTNWLREKEAKLYLLDSQDQTLTLLDTAIIDYERKAKFSLRRGGNYVITVKIN